MKTDGEIIRGSVREASAFAELFERHAQPVHAYAYRRVGADAADDIVSETFLIAFRKRRTFRRDADSARPWLFGIATKVMHRHRESEARHMRALIEALDRDVETTTTTDRLVDRLDAQSDLRRIAPLIAALAARDRDALLLYAWGDLGYEEIAVALAIPVGTVKSRLNRVRRMLAPARERIIRAGDKEEVGHGRHESSS